MILRQVNGEFAAFAGSAFDGYCAAVCPDNGLGKAKAKPVTIGCAAGIGAEETVEDSVLIFL